MRTRRLWRAFVAPAAVLATVGVSIAFIGAPSTGAQAFQSWVAVAEGGDGAAWYLGSASSGWSSLGGRVLTAPAVADYANNPFGEPVPIFAAIGTDHQVWVTNIGSAPTWYPVGGYCASTPAVGIFNSRAAGWMISAPPARELMARCGSSTSS
jgi:hypothetical protein